MEYALDLLQFLNAKNYQTYNRKLAHKIGIEASIFLSELIDKFQYFHDKECLIEKEWFYLSFEDAYDRTALSRSNQETAIKKLKELGIIECKLKGLPARRHFKIDLRKLLEMLSLLFPANWYAESCKLDRYFQQTSHIYKEPDKEPYEEKTPPYPLKGESPETGTPPVGPVMYGKFVSLSKEEFDELRELCGGTSQLKEIIDEINDYLSSTGRKPYKDYAATIRNWLRRKNKNNEKVAKKWNKNQSMTSTHINSNANSSGRDTRAQSSPGLSLGDLLMQT